MDFPHQHVDTVRDIVCHLRDLRKDQGIKVLELAPKLLFTQPNAITRIEKGQKDITLREFLVYCEALNLDPSSIIKKFYTKRPYVEELDYEF
jgi:transcriptional regulator with XRE-family HTH domain